LESQSNTTISADMEQRGFQCLKSMILKKLGLDCSYYRESYLRRRFEIRIRAQGMKSYWDYVKLLGTNANEYERLIKDLTVNYTKFFRDPDVFTYFKATILKNLLEKKKNIRIMSAGCSSGEEPYTLSIILNEALGVKISDYTISIYAVDIDGKSLAKAEGAVYEGNEVSDLGKPYLDKYFTQTENTYQVKDDVKRLVHFGKGDLTQELTHRWLDVIFCRNVFIYFDKPAQAKILTRFHQALQTNGYLIIGKSEIIPDELRSKFKLMNTECRVYQKTDSDSLSFASPVQAQVDTSQAG
jgi:chemotaxis protein methyltransferase CheR